MNKGQPTISINLRNQVKEITGHVLEQYLAIPIEKRQEVEDQGINLANLLTDQLAKLVNHTRVSSVLVVMEEGIGNMVMLTPALQQLRATHPSLKITVLCKDPAAQVIRGCSFVDKVITEFDNTYHDLCFNTIWSAKSQAELGPVFLHYCKATINSSMRTFHESVQHAAICDYMESDGSIPSPHCQEANELEGEELYEMMKNYGLYQEAVEELGSASESGFVKYIVFGDTTLRLPGGEWDKKRWPHYTELAELIRRKFPDYKIVLIGDKDDAEEAAEKSWPENVIFDFMGKINIPQLATLLKHSHIYIGNDTGPTHIAAAVGAKTYAIFGPTLPGKNKPIGENVKVLNKRLPCSPCQYTERFTNCDCINYLTAEEVYQEVFFPSDRRKKVMLVGDFSGGALRNEIYIKRTLDKKLHLKVIAYDYRADLKKEKNDIVASSYNLINAVMYHDPDDILICGGQKIHPAIINILNMLQPNTRIKLWYVDNRGQVEPWFRELSSVCHDSYWSTGDPKLLSQVFSQTQKPCEFLPIVPDPTTYKPMNDVTRDIDVLFVGTPHSKARVELLEYLVDNLPKEINFQIYGPGDWPEKLKSIVNPGVFDKDFNHVLNRAKIVVNQNVINEVPLYFSDRYFYPMATKTVGLNHYIPKLEDMFEDGKHMRFFKDKEECVERINELLANDEQRAIIRKYGHQLFLEKYTLEHILNQLFEE